MRFFFNCNKNLHTLMYRKPGKKFIFWIEWHELKKERIIQNFTNLRPIHPTTSKQQHIEHIKHFFFLRSNFRNVLCHHHFLTTKKSTCHFQMLLFLNKKNSSQIQIIVKRRSTSKKKNFLPFMLLLARKFNMYAHL